MKIFDYRGQKVVLVPDAMANTPENAVVRKLQPDPNDSEKFFLVSGGIDLAFRHELKDTGKEFTP